LAETKKTYHAILFDAFWQKQRRPVLQSSSLLFDRNKEDCPSSSMLFGRNKEEKKTCPAIISMLFGRSKEAKKTCPSIIFNALWQKQRRLSCHTLQCSLAEEKK
jgi:hypothetical protein